MATRLNSEMMAQRTPLDCTEDCAIIIPFYQKEDGILRRAIASAFRQTYSNFHIIVVDDSSPHSAAAELESLPADQKNRIHVIHQDNRGPGGARNSGLDLISNTVRFVAFLDSDDVWHADHLERAVHALSQENGDVYFASIGSEDEFSYHSGIQSLKDRCIFKTISKQPELLEINDLGEQMLWDWSFMHLSCMAMSVNIFRQIRFDETLRTAGEDVLFMHQCLALSRKTLLSPEIGSERGTGCNIFHSVDNQSEKYVGQQACVLRMLKKIERSRALSRAALRQIRYLKQHTVMLMVWGQRRRFKAKKPVQYRRALMFICIDPILVVHPFRYYIRNILNMNHGPTASPTACPELHS